jgi:hypothetical protein
MPNDPGGHARHGAARWSNSTACALVKSLASAVCIGSGGSVGREGPIVQIGSALGSTVGQALCMFDDRIRTLGACGATGGTLKLRRRGIDLRAGRDVDLMRAVPVAQAMSAHVPTASADMSVSEAAEQLDDSGDRALLVLDSAGAPQAIATLQDLQTALLENQPGRSPRPPCRGTTPATG